MKISVGIVTFESESDLLERTVSSLLHALERAKAEYGLRATIFFIVNDVKEKHLKSVSEVISRSKKRASEICKFVTLEGHGNIGYGAAQNKAIKDAGSDYHLVLNPDVSFGDDVLLKSIHYMEQNPGDVVVVPQGYDRADRYAYLSKRAPSVLVLLVRAFSSSWLNRVFRTQLARYTYRDMLPSRAPQSITLASGCFMFCRTTALQAVRGFDEGFFLYFEDFDLSLRLKGVGNIVELPDIRICHYGGDTARRGNKRKYHFVRSAIRFFSRYGWRRPSNQAKISAALDVQPELKTR